MADAEKSTGFHLESYQWKPGQSGNPAGKPKGARTRLGEDFLKKLQEDFREHGVSVIAAVRAERPHEYLKIIAGLLPKELHLKDASLEDAADDELIGILGEIRTLVAAKVGDENRARATAPEEPSSAIN